MDACTRISAKSSKPNSCWQNPRLILIPSAIIAAPISRHSRSPQVCTWSIHCRALRSRERSAEWQQPLSMIQASEIEGELVAFLKREVFAPQLALTAETDLLASGFDSMSLVR